MPLLSVIMPVYNGELYLAEAIESILTQTFADFELIIVDDGSDDNSAAIIRQYVERDDRVRQVQLECNRGQAVALNSGLAVARGKFITTMDYDDVSPPERLQKQVDYLQSHPAIGAVGGCARRMNKDLQPVHDYIAPPHHGEITLWLFLSSAVTQATFMYRREALLSVNGWYPGRFEMQDTELISRLLPVTRFTHLPDILLLIRKHDKHEQPARAAQKIGGGAQVINYLLRLLMDQVPPETWIRFWRLRAGYKFGWTDYRRTRRDIKLLIDAMIAAKWADPSDRPQMETYAARCLERTTPRLWQMFCHWRRHRFSRVNSSP